MVVSVLRPSDDRCKKPPRRKARLMEFPPCELKMRRYKLNNVQVHGISAGDQYGRKTCH